MRAAMDRTSKEQELADLLAPQIAAYAGDFDAWLHNEDQDTVQFANELLQSLHGWRVLTRPELEHQLEALWDDLYRDLAEDYAQAAAWDRERGFSSYANRRGW